MATRKRNNPAEHREDVRKRMRATKQNNKNVKEHKEKKLVADRNRRRERVCKEIGGGRKDGRKTGRLCPRCQKVCVKEEEQDVNAVPGENETFCGFRLDDPGEIHVKWAQCCFVCNTRRHGVDYRKGGTAFDRRHVGTLKRHLAMTSAEIRVVINQLREKCGGICAGCGILTLRKGMSGWKQESFTDIFPSRRPKEAPSCGVEDISIVCLTCQWCQHDLDWEEFGKVIRRIRSGPEQNRGVEFSKQERRWYGILSTHGPNIVDKEVIVARQGRHCHFTGIEMMFESKHWNTASWDRDDSSMPYTSENTHLVCHHINIMKQRSITESELLEWIAHVRGPEFVFTDLPATTANNDNEK